MPRDYYTNMLSLRADIQIVTKILIFREKKLVDHFRKISLDLSLIMVESFLTLFTNTCHPEICDVIIDHFLVDGSVVLIKAMVLMLAYLKEDILEKDNFGTK